MNITDNAINNNLNATYPITRDYFKAIAICDTSLKSLVAKITILAFPIIVLITFILDLVQRENAVQPIAAPIAAPTATITKIEDVANATEITPAPQPEPAPEPEAPAALVFSKRMNPRNVKNVEIYLETMAYAKANFPAECEALEKNSVLIHELKPTEKKVLTEPTKVYVSPLTTMRLTQDMVKRGLNPLAIDMANAYNAGGGVRPHFNDEGVIVGGGANAQEEILSRQSNLMYGLLKLEESKNFPIPETGGFLLPKTTFFRADPSEGYVYLDEPFQADVFAVAAYCCIPGTSNDRPADEATYRANTIAKIENFLEAAKQNGNDSIVAGALGCGAFRNEPEVIAALFKEVLEKPKFQGFFKEIGFGIIEDHNSGGKNFKTFKDILEPAPVVRQPQAEEDVNLNIVTEFKNLEN